MSDDLVATLHQAGHDYTDKAADLIKAQAARIAELEAALRSIVEYCDDPYLPYYKDILIKARAALEGKKDSPTMTEEQLREMMRDPRYWRQRNPEWVKRVTDGFRKLVGGKI